MEPQTLMSAFLAHLGEAGSRAIQSGKTLADALVAVVEKGQQTWPNLDLPPERFVIHLAGVLPTDQPDLAAVLGSIHAADLFLACACIEGSPGAEPILRAQLRVAVEDCAGRVDGDAAFADAVEQVLLNTLLAASDGLPQPRMAAYSGRCALADWVMVAAERATLSVSQRDTATGREHAAMVSARALADEDSELAYLQRYYKDEFESAFANAFGALTDREQALLRLHLGAGVPLEVIARMYGTSLPTVIRWISDAREGLTEESEIHLKQRLRVSPAEFDPVARVLPTQIETRMTQLLFGPARRSSDEPR